MWKQKQWKYKNAAPKVPKKEEWLKGLSASRLMQTSSNYIKAGCSYMAFNVDSSGPGCLGILPIQSGDQKTSTFNLNAHADFVSDLDFSPHVESCLATVSFDGSAKLWNIAVDGHHNTSADLLTAFPNCEKRVECVLWHPYVSDFLSLASAKAVKFFSASKGTEFAGFSQHTDVIQSMAWAPDGKHLATTCKDKIVRIIDPRAVSSPAPAAEAAGHQNVRDTRVIWTDENYLLTTGFNQTLSREVNVYDCRAFKSPVSVTSIDNSNGTLMPFFDIDTAMLFLVGKGDSTVRFCEFSKATPFLLEGGCDAIAQVKGAALVPKRAVNTSVAEVNRLLVLTQSNVIPVAYIVPRKVSSDFYEDLYPETYSGQPVWTLDEWLANEIREIPKVSLKPVIKKFEQAPVSRKNEEPVKISPSQSGFPSKEPAEGCRIEEPVKARPSCSVASSNVPAEDVVATPSVRREVRMPAVFSQRCGKLRNFVGTILHKNLHIDGLQGVSKNVPIESDSFTANWIRCAVILSGAGGQVLVAELDQPGRASSAKHHVLHNGATVVDFAWDPFDDTRLACGCIDGSLKVWLVTADTAATTDVPEFVIGAHHDRVHSLRFHPMAKDVLASSSFDQKVKIWDLSSQSMLFELEGHADMIFAIAWSSDGSQLATYCRDRNIRIFKPRESTLPLQEFVGPTGLRGGRIVWVQADKYLFISAFDRLGGRLVALYDVQQSSHICTVDVDTATSVLVPFYDADNSAVFLTGRGDTTVYAYEIINEQPHLLPLLNCAVGKTPHQALGFLSKQKVDVSRVEFLKAYRLTASTIEPISFTVPRVKMEFFQDDIFPDTAVTWEPVLTAAEWMSHEGLKQKFVSLCPPGMKKVSELSSQPSSAPKPDATQPPSKWRQPAHPKVAATRQDELVTSMNECFADTSTDPLPQDLVEGVDPSEWD